MKENILQEVNNYIGLLKQEQNVLINKRKEIVNKLGQLETDILLAEKMRESLAKRLKEENSRLTVKSFPEPEFGV